MGFGFLEPDQARELIAQGQAGVVVVRDPGSFEAGHIGGAISLGEHNVGAFVSESDKDIPLIVCCYHGISSQGAAAYFAEQGFREVYSLNGGYDAWACSEQR